MGAYDYITKPFKVDELQLSIQRALDHQHDKREIRNLRQIVKEKYRFENIIGTSQRMQEIYNLIAKVADTDSTILIQGESGTGKELVARALHFNSNRQHQPFVAINCSALPENLLESELFGHKKGAFTGAVQDKIGLFEEAEMGTIFLDEVNSMAVSLQTKLLRVLQERQIRRVGDTKTSADQCARPRRHQRSAAATRSRAAIFARISTIASPSSRSRCPRCASGSTTSRCWCSISSQKNSAQTDTEPKKIDPKALDVLQHYRWPGNVRELENAIERACALCDDGIIRVQDLPPQVVRQATAPAPESHRRAPGRPDRSTNTSASRSASYIEETIKFNGGSREKAAKMLGISMATLYRKLEVKKAAEAKA